MTAPPTSFEDEVLARLRPVHWYYQIAIVTIVIVAGTLGVHLWKAGVADAAVWKDRAQAVIQRESGERQAAAAAIKGAAAVRDSLARQGRHTDSLERNATRYVVPAVPRAVVVHDTPPAMTVIANGPPWAVPLPDSLRDVPLVRASDYDAAVTSCTRERHDCTSALAKQDTAILDIRRALASSDSGRLDNAKLYQAERRRSLLEKLGFGGVGFTAGYAACVATMHR